MKEIKTIIFEYENKQFKSNIGKTFPMEFNKEKKKEIETDKIILIETNKKTIIGKPYIENRKITIELEFKKKIKKKLIKFKRRKRYKIIKGIKYIKYKAKIKKIWLKKKL